MILPARRQPVDSRVRAAAAAGDPLEGWSRRALARLARRASRAWYRRVDGLDRLSARTTVPVRRLRMLGDAWNEGGDSGVQALGPAPARDEVDKDELRRIDGALEAWRRRHYPLETLRWDVWRNRVSVWHLMPGSDRRGDLERRPLAHLRLTQDGRWHLYRKASKGEWWPVLVRGRRAPQDMHDCLEAIRLDPEGRFWHTPPRSYEGSDFWFGPGRYRT